MKTVFTVLFLCSAAVSQQAAVPQSSRQVKRSAVRKAAPDPMGSMGWATTATTINFAEPQSFYIQGSGRKLMVTIYLKTGAVEFGKDYDLDETAKTFWIALGHKMASCTDGAQPAKSGKPATEKTK